LNMKPTEPPSLCSVRSTTDRLNELSLKIDGSAMSSLPLVGFKVVIINLF